MKVIKILNQKEIAKFGSPDKYGNAAAETNGSFESNFNF